MIALLPETVQAEAALWAPLQLSVFFALFLVVVAIVAAWPEKSK